MTSHVNGMRHIGPQNGVLHRQVARPSPKPPTVVVKCQTVVARTKKHIVHQPVVATHQIYSVAPPPGRETLHIPDRHLTALAAQYGVMLGLTTVMPSTCTLRERVISTPRKGWNSIPRPTIRTFFALSTLSLAFTKAPGAR